MMIFKFQFYKTKYLTLIYLLLLSFIVSCSSSSKGITFTVLDFCYNDNIQSYKTETSNYVDDTIFALKGYVFTKDSIPFSEGQVRVMGNRPLSILETSGSHEYIEYVMSGVFKVNLDKDGSFDFYFTSPEYTTVHISGGRNCMSVQPVLGQQKSVYIYLNN